MLPGTGVDARRLLGRLRRHRAPTWRRRTPRCWPSATACRPSSTPGTAPTPARSRRWRPTARSCSRSATWCRSRPRCKATTKNVDAELALQAGPQLVVPILNARYALNAANARWGSLYDALYGTDALPETDGAEQGRAATTRCAAPRSSPTRATCSTARAPLKKGSHVDSHRLPRRRRRSCAVTLKNGSTRRPDEAGAVRRLPGRGRRARRRCCCRTTACTSTSASTAAPPSAPATPPASATWCSESALSTILDLEDSVAVVDADDKVLAYGNWLGILKGTLTEEVSKGGKTFTRGLNPDRVYTGPQRRGRDAARPLAAVRAQRRPPDDEPGRPVGRRRPRDPRRHPRRRGHHHDRAARPAAPRRRRHPQLAHAARSTSSSRRCTARPRWPSPASCSAASSSCWACRRPPSSSASWTRSAAPAST